jgi:hypothetical protein
MLHRLPHLIELQPPAASHRRLLVVKSADCNVVYIVHGGHVQDLLVYQVESDRAMPAADLELVLSKGFNLLMWSLWSELN